jgi:hypothetical protein
MGYYCCLKRGQTAHVGRAFAVESKNWTAAESAIRKSGADRNACRLSRSGHMPHSAAISGRCCAAAAFSVTTLDRSGVLNKFLAVINKKRRKYMQDMIYRCHYGHS